MTGHVSARRVLVVDDEKPLATLVATCFEREGFEVSPALNGQDPALNGQDAVDVARQVDPDVVVLDLGLPRWTASRSAGGSGRSRTATW